MTVEVKHSFQSLKGDGVDTSLVRPTDWNALHVFEMAGTHLLGREDSGIGPATEIALGEGLKIQSGILSNTYSKLPTGVVLPLAANYTPPGWLLCYGQLESTTAYPGLFAVLGIKFGGDGVSTFGIPDMRGRVPAGKDNIGGTAANRLTSATIPGGALDVTSLKVGGTERHVLTVNQLAKHKHGASDTPHWHYVATTDAPATSSPSLSATQAIARQNRPTNDIAYAFEGYSTDATVGWTSYPDYGVDEDDEPIVPTDVEVGLDEPHLNLQPTIIMNYIIYTGENP